MCQAVFSARKVHVHILLRETIMSALIKIISKNAECYQGNKDVLLRATLDGAVTFELRSE